RHWTARRAGRARRQPQLVLLVVASAFVVVVDVDRKRGGARRGAGRGGGGGDGGPRRAARARRAGVPLCSAEHAQGGIAATALDADQEIAHIDAVGGAEHRGPGDLPPVDVGPVRALGAGPLHLPPPKRQPRVPLRDV